MTTKSSRMAKVIETKCYELVIPSTDMESVAINGYYSKRVVVPFEVFKLVQLMEYRIEELESQLKAACFSANIQKSGEKTPFRIRKKFKRLMM